MTRKTPIARKRYSPLVDRIRAAKLGAHISEFGPTKQAAYRRAAAIVHRAMQIGAVKPAPACDFCKARGPVEGHHRDYFFPLKLTWLCHTCHRVEHARLYYAGEVVPGGNGLPRYRFEPELEPVIAPAPRKREAA